MSKNKTSTAKSVAERAANAAANEARHQANLNHPLYVGYPRRSNKTPSKLIRLEKRRIAREQQGWDTLEVVAFHADGTEATAESWTEAGHGKA